MMKRPNSDSLKRPEKDLKRMNIRDYFHTSPIRQSLRQAILDPNYQYPGDTGKMIRLSGQLE